MSDEKKIVKQIPTQRTRAEFVAETFNEADRTVEVTFATEAAVRTFDWENYETINEILVCDEKSGDLTRLNSGAPVLDNHNRYGKTADVVVGVVENARFEKGKGVAKVRFGTSDYDTQLMNKVRDKIVTGVSVGYNVYEYQVTRAIDKVPDYRATKWEATEISFAPVQADVDSRVRNESGNHEVTINEEVQEAPVEEITETETKTEEINNNEIKNKKMPDPEVKPEVVVVETEATRAAAKSATERVLAIQGKCRALGLDDKFANTLIADESVTIDVASTRALAEWEKKQPANPVPASEAVVADAEKTRAAMSDALVLRIDGNAIKVMEPERVRAAADFRGQSLLRFAEEALIRSGIRTAGMSPKEIATVALGGKIRGMQHTTDFPLLLMSTVQRTLLAQYALQARTFADWAKRATISDFRPITRVRLSEILGNLEEVKEGAEYKYDTMSESGETYQLAKYGKIISITWEAIINDDLSAFTRIPQAFAAKAAQLQSNLVYNTILSNGFANMADGNALFSAAHGNFVGTDGDQTAGGTALSEASLTVAYQKFLQQTGPDGSFITVAPKFLVVGPKNAFLAMKMTSANYTPNTQANIPVAALVGLKVIVEPRITGNTWFLIADPASIDTVEYAFLAGEEELFIDQREGFNIDGVEVKARMVFAAKPIDWRGVFRNNGA